MHYEHPVYTPESVAAQTPAARAERRRARVRRRLPRLGLPRGRLPAGVRGRGVAGGARGEAARAPAGAARLARTAALYDVEVRHVRHAALRARRSRHRIYLWLVDLDALPRLPALAAPVRRVRARATTSATRRGTHPGQPGRASSPATGSTCAAAGCSCSPTPACSGYVFNPLTVYWCHRADGTLACVVAEVHNTYGERHCYLLRTRRRRAGHGRRKEFYVSPFLPVDGEYRMRLPEPDERLDLAITLRAERRRRAFVATRGRGAATAATPRRARPAAGCATRSSRCRTSALIRRHGIALWLRRLPVVPRPRHAPQEGVRMTTYRPSPGGRTTTSCHGPPRASGPAWPRHRTPRCAPAIAEALFRRRGAPAARARRVRPTASASAAAARSRR